MNKNKFKSNKKTVIVLCLIIVLLLIVVGLVLKNLSKNSSIKNEIVGIWFPEKVLDSSGNEWTNYFGSYAEQNGDNYLEFYSNYTFKNYLHVYGDESEITGTYKIENNKIYLTYNNGSSTYIICEKLVNNEIVLQLQENDATIYLSNDNDKIEDEIHKNN